MTPANFSGWLYEKSDDDYSPAFARELLEVVSEPALLVDTIRGQIVAVNSQFRKFTGWDEKILTQQPVRHILSGMEDRQLIAGEVAESDLITASKTGTQVVVTATRLDATGKWLVYKIIPKSTKAKTDITASVISHAILNLIENKQGSEETWFEQCVEVIRDLLQADTVAIYQAAGNSLDLVKTALVGDGEGLPDVLPASDLIRLASVESWQSGKRVLTEIHRSARAGGFSVVISAPLQQGSASFGLLVVAGKGWVPPEGCEDILRLFGAFLAGFPGNLATHEADKEDVEVLGYQENVSKQIIENMHEGVILLSPTLNIIRLNAAAEWMLSYATSEVEGAQVDTVLIGSSRLQPAIESACQGIAMPAIGPVELHRRDGQVFSVQAQVFPILEKEVVAAIVVLLNDISENEEIRAKAQHLEQRAAMGDFTAVFAHDMRNPINSIKSALDLVSSTLAPEDPNQEILIAALADVDRLTHYVESVLAFVRPLEPKFEILEIEPFIKRLFMRWHPRFSAANVTTSFVAESELPRVKLDQRSFERVITNLFGNALEAMQKTENPCLGVKISLCSDSTEHQQIQIAISDNGSGIPEDMKPMLFTSFVTSNKATGTGLGLAITKRIVTANRGSISFESVPGGTVFFIKLPAYEEGE